MKLLFRLLAVAIVCTAFGFKFDTAHAATKTSKTQLELCGSSSQNYLFALCAATTCRDTGKRVAVTTPNGGKRWFKEASCTCPVVNTNATNAGLTGKFASAYATSLPSIANVGGGNMKGSCDYPNGADQSGAPIGGIWSLYSLTTQFPQHTALPTPQNPNPDWGVLPATINACSKKLLQGREFANCFSFKCGAPYLDSHNVLVSDCSCPKGEDVLSALPAPPATSFFTNAGGNSQTQAEKDQYCKAHPVGGF